MNPHLLIFLVGLLYILGFGGLSLVRREGLSIQFAAEGLIITGLVEVIALILNVPVSPLAFLIFLYLITMRGRLLVDVANLFSSRGRQGNAIKLLQLASDLRPDRTTRLVILINMGIVQLRRKNPASAQQLLEEVLREMEAGAELGIKYEAACRYNLGQALLQQDQEAEAVRQFNETINIFPSSIYAQSAERILGGRRSRRPEKSADLPDDEA